jgi:hypothetical protein
MFTERKLKNYADLLNLSVEEFDTFMKRYKNYILSKNELTKNVLINGLFILEEITTKKLLLISGLKKQIKFNIEVRIL